MGRERQLIFGNFFCRKLNENERNLAERGHPPMDLIGLSQLVTIHCVLYFNFRLLPINFVSSSTAFTARGGSANLPTWLISLENCMNMNKMSPGGCACHLCLQIRQWFVK